MIFTVHQRLKTFCYTYEAVGLFCCHSESPVCNISNHSIVSQSAQKPCDCHGLGFCVFLLSLTASSMSFPSVFPFVTSPVLFPPHSPHLFLIPLLVSVYLVFVLPALLVSSLCDVPVFPMSPLRNATADHSFQLLSDCSCTTYTSTSTIFCNYPVQ